MSAPIYSGTQLEQSWFFDWNPSDNPSPPPITAECETINIIWRRPPAIGPDPIGPFFIQVLTSLYIVPFTVPTGNRFDYQLTIPFPPGTRYQVCMYDSAGNTGGCQQIYTVYRNPDIPATCSNLTFPSPLAVKTATSQTGWPPQCSYLELNGIEGTPPYTFTAAPSLRPPTVIKGIGGDGIRWQVPYGHATPFFVQLVDSTGRAWSWGPLHAGDGPDTSCLDYKRTVSTKTSSPVASIIGATIGALVLGTLFGFTIKSLWARRRRQTNGFETPMIQHARGSDTLLSPTPFLPFEPNYGESSRPPTAGLNGNMAMGYSSNQGGTGHENNRQPDRVDGQQSQIFPSAGAQYSAGADGDARRPSFASGAGVLSPDGSRMIDPRVAMSKAKESYTQTQGSSSPQAPSDGRSSQVYVIHQDSGRPPVSIITDNATQVVELPPQYGDGIHAQNDNYNHRSSQSSQPTPSQPRF